MLVYQRVYQCILYIANYHQNWDDIYCTDGFGHGHKTPVGPNMVRNWDLKL